MKISQNAKSGSTTGLNVTVVSLMNGENVPVLRIAGSKVPHNPTHRRKKEKRKEKMNKEEYRKRNERSGNERNEARKEPVKKDWKLLFTKNGLLLCVAVAFSASVPAFAVNAIMHTSPKTETYVMFCQFNGGLLGISCN